MVLRPAVHAQHDWACADADVMLKQTVGNNLVVNWIIHKLLLYRCIPGSWRG